MFYVSKLKDETVVKLESEYDIHSNYSLRNDENFYMLFSYIQNAIRNLEKNHTDTFYYLLEKDKHYILINPSDIVSNLKQTYNLKYLKIKVCKENFFG